MGKYQVNITLSRLAAVAISRALWKHSSLKNPLMSCIEKESDPKDHEMASFVEQVLQDLKIAKDYKKDLEFVVARMGLEIWEWIRELRETYCWRGAAWLKSPELSNSIDYICWTDYGCVDKSATIRSLYVSKMLPDNWNTWIKLCRYCLKDCINDFWSKSDERCKFDVWGIHGERQFSNIISNYWISRMRNDLEPAIEMFDAKFYDAVGSLEGTMFVFSFLCGKYSATKYFWELLNEDQRVRAIVYIDQKIFSDDPDNKPCRNEFFSLYPLGDVLMFLLAKSSEYCLDDMRIRILGSGYVLGQLLRWPYDNVFMEIFRESSIHHDSIDYKPIMFQLLINVQNQCAFLHSHLTYYKICNEIRIMNPENFKSCVFHPSVLDLMDECREAAMALFPF